MSRDPTLTIQNFFKQSEDIPVNAKWDTLWQNNQTPWDRGGSSPALEELVVDKKFPLVLRGGAGRALIPGCGRGYDVALFAGLKGEDQRFEKVVGLDVSPKALGEARKLHGKENIAFLEGDFFSETDEWAKLAPYDVVYDYTFLCALEPKIRTSWAKRMAEIIRPGTGLLIALQFPITPHLFHQEDRNRGPPFLLSPELYDELLGGEFDRIYFERPTKSHPTIGTEDMMSVWRRKI